MPAPIRIELSAEEKRIASEEARRRQSANERLGLAGRNNAPSVGAQALKAHLLGAAGEMAVASYLGLKHGLYRENSAIPGSCDLPGMIDVKTRNGHRRDLIVQRNENPWKKFILVTIENKEILIRGWCHGSEAMLAQFWKDPAKGRPAYFVPQSVLHALDELR